MKLHKTNTLNDYIDYLINIMYDNIQKYGFTGLSEEEKSQLLSRILYEEDEFDVVEILVNSCNIVELIRCFLCNCLNADELKEEIFKSLEKSFARNLEERIMERSIYFEEISEFENKLRIYHEARQFERHI